MTIDKERIILAQKMREARESAGIYQDVCHKHYGGISKSTYIRWERFGPPDNKVMRAYVRLIIKKLKARGRDNRYDARDPERRRADNRRDNARYRARKKALANPEVSG